MSDSSEAKAPGDGSTQAAVEANALFIKRQYKEAYAKFSEAIKVDSNNAGLYASRAACSIAEKDFMNAFGDARKATEIDPTSVKGWARLGRAALELHRYELSATSLKRAIALCTPDDGSSPSDEQRKAKKSYENSLKQVNKAVAELERKAASRVTLNSVSTEDAPWTRARKIWAYVDKHSSAAVIVSAHTQFSDGVQGMKKIIRLGPNSMAAVTAAILHISNGILQDRRAFYVDCHDWFQLLQDQMRFEAHAFEAWLEVGTTEVQESALQLLQKRGWDVTRRALTATIRRWFMLGFIESVTTEDHKAAVQYYRSALAVLDWGAEIWRDVPKTLRGAIFSKTFIRGIRRFYIHSYLSAYQDKGPNDDFTLIELDKLAVEMIRETRANPPADTPEYGHVASFATYPLAEAYATRGFVCMQRGLDAKQNDSSGTGRAVKAHFSGAAAFYKRASDTLPPDEEMRLHYLKVAFEALWHAGRALKDVLDVCQIVHDLEPQISIIWEYGPNRAEMQRHVSHVYKFEEDAFEGMMQGKWTIEDPANVVQLVTS